MIKELVKEMVLTAASPVHRRDVCRQFGISEAGASAILSGLVAKGILSRIGEGRSTAYVGDLADSYLRMRDGRKEVEYDFDRIRLHGGKSSFFTAEQMGAFNRCGKLTTGITRDDYLISVQKRLLIETSWASSALEGNTYTLIDTQDLFERGIEMSGAKQEETQMLLNHKHAIEYIIENIDAIDISRMDIINIHALLSEGLMKDPADVGRLRVRSVGIGQSTYRPIDVPTMLSEEFDVLIAAAKEIENVFDRSFFLFANIAYLQPFADVNKRTSRLVANIPLLKSGMMPMSFYQMSRSGYEKGLLHYYETGDFRRLANEYLAGYEISSRRFADLIENKPSPTALRLRMKYRKVISDCVYNAVKHDQAVSGAIPSDVPEDDAEFIANYAEKILESISEGNAILYGLTEADLSGWRNRSSFSNK